MIANTLADKQVCPICKSGYIDDYRISVPGFSGPQPESICRCGSYTVFVSVANIIKIEAAVTEVFLNGEPTGCFSYRDVDHRR